MPAHLIVTCGYPAASYVTKAAVHVAKAAAPHVANATVHVAKAAAPHVVNATTQVFSVAKDGGLSLVSVVIIPFVKSFVSELGKDTAKSVVSKRRALTSKRSEEQPPKA